MQSDFITCNVLSLLPTALSDKISHARFLRVARETQGFRGTLVKSHCLTQ